jgi:hypothetical protein
MKLIFKFVVFSCFLQSIVYAEERVMNEQEAQVVWDEYHERIKNRRIAQAHVINSELVNFGITAESDLILDFTFFTQKEDGANGLKTQLSENYEISITKENEYWHIQGTTRPYVVSFTNQQHLGWVEFMHDVALSHGAIFSTWTITESKSGQVWSNKNIETEFD